MEEKFDSEGLSTHDGKEGRPAYIAHGGRVIDVSKSRLWAKGLHMGRHHAGVDLTLDIEAAPHGTEVLDRYPQVGVFEEGSKTETVLPPLLASVMARYPFFRRHPHPASVHFPIVLTFATSFFWLLFVMTGNDSFDQTAFYCLIGALVFTPLAILTGLLTWWVNYMARPMRPVTIKQVLSLASLAVMVCLLIWRIMDPMILQTFPGPGSVLYFVLALAISPAIFVVSYYGGTLTFPIGKE